ncbi:MAG: polysaccharide biosynthesis protein [Planctomycetota bacterium]|jgi:FlaA1/EpsC-like NDP-sugar epimerase
MKRAPHSELSQWPGNGREGSSSSDSPTSGDQIGRRNLIRRYGERAISGVAGQLLAKRVWLLLLAHLAVFRFIYWLAFELRFDFAMGAESWTVYSASLPWVIAVKLGVFYALGQYHGWWRYVTFADMVALIRASVLSLVLIVVIDQFVFDVKSHWTPIAFRYQIPRSIPILDCVLSIMFLGGMRASWRLFREHFQPIFYRNGCRWALLVGADHSSAILAYQIQSHFQLPYRVRGFLAISNARKGSRLGQIPILGNLGDLQTVAAAYRITDVLVTAGTLSGGQLRQLMDTCDQSGLNLKIIRSVEDRFSGDHRVPIRDIEINDLLQRDPVELDTETIGNLLENRTIMVTGAGGSIGSEICRQLLKFNFKELILVGRGENRIFAIERELQALDPAARLHACIGDVTDEDRMRQLFEEFRPEVVFHAAAHKHVPLMEVNVGEAVKTNVFGTECLADLSDEYDVQAFVFISTDKAVHPSSVMGVTKNVAERYVHALSQASSTRFTVVRFGNVLGAEGSVVPVFQEQIRCGGPITVTDPRMKRFFMTIPEASQLVLQAAGMGSGGEIFVLEMGEPVRIVDLARDLIRLSGLPEDAIEISFNGIRRGEKLFEELYFDDEQTLPTAHPKLRAAYARPFSLASVRRTTSELARLIHGPEDLIRQKLHQIVPEYVATPEEIGEPEDQLLTEADSLKPHQ